jgi:aminoglycoside phosphotransferase (APT) family kinase protein
VRAPGALLAAGRDCDIFEYAPGLVLRRSRVGRSMAAEARTMDYVRSHGYPVPAVEDISEDGADMVLERIDGPSMVGAAGRRPWAIRRYGGELADLHRRLHDIPAPDFLPAAPVGHGQSLLHLDLHPLNVVVGRRGPVVIDWPNAARGDPAVDIAIAWVLTAVAEIPGGRATRWLLERGRSQLVNGFLARFDLAPVTAALRDVVEWKVKDPNIHPDERDAMWRIVDAATSSSDQSDTRP